MQEKTQNKNERPFIKFEGNLNHDFSTFKKPEKIWDADPKFVEKAYKNICIMWNKNYKSRGFIKHLIGSFFPINMFNKIAHTQPNMKCAILGIKLAGLFQISESIAKINTEKLFIDAKYISSDKSEYSKEDLEKIENLKKSIPIEHRTGSIAYFSDDSTKYLSIEALQALLIFSEKLIMFDDREMIFTINKKRISESQTYVNNENKLNKNEINKVTKAITYGNKIVNSIDEKTLNTLKKLKNQLKENENVTK